MVSGHDRADPVLNAGGTMPASTIEATSPWAPNPCFPRSSRYRDIGAAPFSAPESWVTDLTDAMGPPARSGLPFGLALAR